MASSLLEADALALGGCPPSAQAFLLTDDLPSPLGGSNKPTAAAAAAATHAPASGGMLCGGSAAAGPSLLAPSYAVHGGGLVPVSLAATPQLGLHGGMGLHMQQHHHHLQQPWSGVPTAGSSFASDAPTLTTFNNNPPSSDYLPHPYHPQLPLSQPMLQQPQQQQQYPYLQQQQQQFYAQHHHQQQQQLFLQQRNQCFPYQTQQPYPAAMQQHHPQMPLQHQALPQPSFPAHQHMQQLQAQAQAQDRYSAQASGGSASSGASERRLYSLVRVDAATGALLREATEDDAREAARLIESDSSCSVMGSTPLPRALSFVDGGSSAPAAAAAPEGSSGVGGREQRAPAPAAPVARGGASEAERRQDASGGGGNGGVGASTAARQKQDQAARPTAEKRTGPCCHCGAVESPQWRKGPASKPVLCNACGTRFRRTHQLGPPIPSAARAAAASAAPKRKAPAGGAGGGTNKKAARGGS